MNKNLKILLIILGVVAIGGLGVLAFQSSEPVEDIVVEESELDNLAVDEDAGEDILENEEMEVEELAPEEEVAVDEEFEEPVFDDTKEGKEDSFIENGFSETEEKKIKNTVKYFMEEAYIKKNYKEVSSLYIPPEGFENSWIRGSETVEGYIEWYVSTVSGLLKNVTHVEIVDIYKCSPGRVYYDIDSYYEAEFCAEDDILYVSFSFIKENGEPILYGPCCGADGPPGSLFFTRVIKIEEHYMVYEDLPYIP